MGGFSSQIVPLLEQSTGVIVNTLGANNASRQRDADQAAALANLQAQQNAQLQDLEQRAAIDRAEIEARADEAERERRAALRRSVARQRAAFGSSGVSTSGGGSSEAVLLGLFEESDADRQERERLDNLRLGAIDQNLDNQRRLNLIQRTQLQERQRISNFGSGLSSFASGSNSFFGLTRLF